MNMYWNKFSICLMCFIVRIVDVCPHVRVLPFILYATDEKDNDRQKWQTVNGYSIHSKSIRVFFCWCWYLASSKWRRGAPVDRTSIHFVIQTHPSKQRCGTDSWTQQQYQYMDVGRNTHGACDSELACSSLAMASRYIYSRLTGYKATDEDDECGENESVI